MTTILSLDYFHDVTSEDDVKPPVCHLCCIAFADEDSLQQHQVEMHNTFSLPTGQLGIKTEKKDLENTTVAHIEQETSQNPDVCHPEFHLEPMSVKLEDSMNQKESKPHLDRNAEDVKPCVCPWCLLLFTDVVELQNHMILCDAEPESITRQENAIQMTSQLENNAFGPITDAQRLLYHVNKTSMRIGPEIALARAVPVNHPGMSARPWLRCELCHRHFFKQHRLEKHIRQEHGKMLRK